MWEVTRRQPRKYRSFWTKFLKGLREEADSGPTKTHWPLRGRLVVVWASASVAGLRFLYLERHCRAGFQAWLDSMEAQLRFRESAMTDECVLRTARILFSSKARKPEPR